MVLENRPRVSLGWQCGVHPGWGRAGSTAGSQPSRAGGEEGVLLRWHLCQSPRVSEPLRVPLARPTPGLLLSPSQPPGLQSHSCHPRQIGQVAGGLATPGLLGVCALLPPSCALAWPGGLAEAGRASLSSAHSSFLLCTSCPHPPGPSPPTQHRFRNREDVSK